jgi:dipeptide transport system ATP-binding protein
VSEAVLDVRNLTREFHLGGWGSKATVLKAVNDVSFSVAQGRTLAIVGESGSGKTTVGRIVASFDEPTSGEIELEGRPVLRMNRQERREVRKSVQMVFQNPLGSLNPRKTIRATLEEPLKVNGLGSRPERVAEVLSMLRRVGLREEHADRYPNSFSGGQCQRIAIARSLMLRPKVIVADEPVSALDVSVQAQILNLLMDLQDEFRTTYIFISHDLSVVRHIAHDVLVMYRGKAVEYGPKEQIFSAPAHEYTRLLLDAAPSMRRAGIV